jgi:long-chain acyl-CoA synthetase
MPAVRPVMRVEPVPAAAIGRGSLAYPPIPVDGLLRRAARRWPDRLAIRTGEAAVTFAELDAAVDRCAAAVRELVGGPGVRCAVVTAADASFAQAFYAVVRAGNVVVTLNPLRHPDALVRTITTAGASLALVTPEVYRALAPHAAQLPPMVLLDRPDADPGTDVPALSDLRADTRRLPVTMPGDVACLHFTSGTTGAPKGVLLTHRNLVANAMQTAQAHGLDDTSVILNCLPAYHLMHLNAGMSAGATQVLCRSRDVVDTVAAANMARATHYYSLPVFLARLAADPRLPGLRLSTVRGIFSGGSALPVPAARELAGRFGVPVVQGFGLAETTSMTHLDRPEASRPGSVGVPAADTECRIVDVAARQPLPAGQPGEIQVRGPQLMRGYLDGDTGRDAEGWLSTGDVGYVDADGWLYLVDRLKDVFKCDNELVAPSELEQVLGRHPQVADCAVVDRPDPLHGAVPHALVVLRDGPASLADVVAAANEHLAAAQRIRTATPVDAIPRTPVGKIARRELRARPDGPATPTPTAHPAPTDRSSRVHADQ